jgi:hypothetical protein
MIQPGSFAATQVGFDEEAAQREARRCFRCDAMYGGPVVDVRAGRGPDVVPPPSAPQQFNDTPGGTR